MNGFVILSERSESKDLLRSLRSTVKSPERSFDYALRAPLRMTTFFLSSLLPKDLEAYLAPSLRELAKIFDF